MTRIMSLLCLLILSACLSSPAHQEISPSSSTIESQEAAKAAELHRKLYPVDLSDISPATTSIRIRKGAYRLDLMQGDNILKTYPVVFGPNPIDDKMMEGDGCTPEGQFKVKMKYEHKKWSRFLWVDYPNEDSWRKFNERKEKGIIPASATIGGEIGIHGVPNGADGAITKRNNWTLGCISLKNADVIELYDLVQEGTPILIVH